MKKLLSLVFILGFFINCYLLNDNFQAVQGMPVYESFVSNRANGLQVGQFLEFGTVHGLPITEDGTPTVTQIGTAGSTSTASYTIGSNNNRILICNLCYIGSSASVTSVKIGSTAFTKLTTGTSGGSTGNNDVWYLIAPPTGSQTVTVTWSASGFTSVFIGLVSLYNVDQVTGLQNATVVNATTSTNPSVTVTPTVAGSWVMQMESSSGVPSSQNHTLDYNSSTSLTLEQSCQHYTSPTIGSGNAMTFTSGTSIWGSIGFEILRF